MVEILLNWINNEVKLSKKIDNLTEDFSNGYFFGELLYKYKLLPQFNQFRNSKDKTSITKNYLLLQYKFDELKINFTDKDKNDLLSKKKYKAEMILFQIREKILSKLLQINQINERTKIQKEMDKLYRDIINNQNPRQRIQSAKVGTLKRRENTNDKGDQNIEEEKTINKSKNKKERLISAKLPKLDNNLLNIEKNKKCISGIESLVVNNSLSTKDNYLAKETIKDIEIYENMHMKNKRKINLLEKKLHKNEESKEKRALNIWQKSYYQMKKFEEEKKEKDLKQLKRLKSATQRAFKIANQNNIKNIIKFDENIDRLGLKMNIDSNREEQKKNEISTEHYMKKIIEELKKRESLRKQFEKRNRRMNKDNLANSINEDNKIINENVSKNMSKNISKYKSRPKSSATTPMIYSTKNMSTNKSKISYKDKIRPLTTKNFQNQNDLKKNILFKNDKNIDNNKLISYSKNFNNQFKENNPDISIGGSQLSQIAENTSFMNNNKKINNNIFFDDYISNEIYDENKFFEKLFRESGNYFQMKSKKRQEKLKNHKKNIEKIVYSLIDITDLCYNYKNESIQKLVDVQEWNKITNNFINNNPIIVTKKEKPKPKLVPEDLDNSSFNLYNIINEKEIKKFGQYEYDELRNYIYLIGDKYDPAKNCLFVKKCKLGQDKLDINDVMAEEDLKIMIEDAQKSGLHIIDEDDKEDSINNKNKYIASKEEKEILEPYKEKYPFNLIFTNLISESIKFSYDKDPKTFKPNDTSKVIEEEITMPQQNEILENEGNIKKNNLNEEEINKTAEENKLEHINTINDEEEKKIDIKDLINSIPVRLSFLGVQKTEKKTRAKNLEKKFPGLKIYNLIDLKKQLEGNNMTQNDENIIELIISKIREDFSFKNPEDIKKEIIKKREDVSNLKNEIEKLKDEQDKKVKNNVTKEIQNIQQQIDNITHESIKGFILIGIPENIHQLKLMEKKIMGFTQPCEKGIENYEKINEDLLFICDQPQKENKEEQIYNLFLNKIVHFDSNKDVIFQKIDNRKKDPVKGDIYQMNLFPPTDKKILARLEDILKPTHEEIEQDIIKDTTNYELIESFYVNNKVNCTNFKGYIINENINEITNYKNYLQLLEQNQKELDEKMSKEIEEALNIYEDQIVGINNENLPLCEESGIIENTPRKEKKESELSEQNNNTINKTNQLQSNKKENKDSNNSSITLINDISRINSNKNMNITPGEISVCQLNCFSPTLLSEKELFNTYQIWKNLIYFYTNQYYKIFYKEKLLGGGMFIERLNKIQKDFIQFISRPSDKKIIINQFLNKYKEFSTKCKYIQNTTIARAKYLDDIDELNETIWKIVEIRKFESIDKIKNYSKIIDQELNICYNNMEKKVILETQKFLEIINILLRFISKSKIVQINTNTNQNQSYAFIINNPVEELLRKCDECKLAEYIEKKRKYNYPKANRIYKNCLSILIKLHTYLSKNIFKPHEKLIYNHSPSARGIKRVKTKKKNPKILSKESSLSNKSQFNNICNQKTNEIQNQLKLSIKAEIEKYKYIIYNLYINSLETLSKIYCASKLVFKLMDDWVIDSLLYQDKAMGAILNKLKKCSIEEIIKDKSILSEESIYSNIELDDFSKKYVLFNYDEFLSDGKSEEKQNISIDELMGKDIGNDIIKNFRFFTTSGSSKNTNNNNIFGEFITLIKDNEIQKGWIKKSCFEKIFFLNKIIMNKNNKILPQFFYNIDFHNISLFLSHFIKLSTDFIDSLPDNNNSKNEVNTIREENSENESNSEDEKKNKEENNDINEKNFNENSIGEKDSEKKIIPQELIATNQIVTILLLICFEIIPENEVEKLLNENKSKLINGKYLNKNDFILNNFWFEDLINNQCKEEKKLAEQLKIFLFDINENINGLINFIQFIDLCSLKLLHFKDPMKINEIHNYYHLFYN